MNRGSGQAAVPRGGASFGAPPARPPVRPRHLRVGQALLSTTLALIVLADGAADAAVAAPDDAEEEPVEGEDAGLAAGRV